MCANNLRPHCAKIKIQKPIVNKNLYTVNVIYDIQGYS